MVILQNESVRPIFIRYIKIFHYVYILYFVYSLIHHGWIPVLFVTNRNHGLCTHFCVDIGFQSQGYVPKIGAINHTATLCLKI